MADPAVSERGERIDDYLALAPPGRGIAVGRPERERVWARPTRTTAAARAVMEGESFDDLDDEAGLRPTGEEPEPLTVGDTAELHLLRSSSEELELLAALIEERLAAGADPADLAVLVDVRRKGDEVTRPRPCRHPDPSTGPLRRHPRRGSAGRHVQAREGPRVQGGLRPGLAAAEWPSRWFVPPDLPFEQQEERVALQRRRCSWG